MNFIHIYYFYLDFLDINECDFNNGGCVGSCENTHGSYKCGCADGQYLSNDGKSCTGMYSVSIYFIY